jgi:hypothetical protein
MDRDSLLTLPAFDSVADIAVGFLLEAKNVAIVGPPGVGATSLALRIYTKLSTAGGVSCTLFDCREEGDLCQRIENLSVPPKEEGHLNVIIIDHGNSLTLTQLEMLSKRLSQLAVRNLITMLWLGALDVRSIKAVIGVELKIDTRTHLCLPELASDDLIRLYRSIADAHECQWGQAMLYFALDWCGNDLTLAKGLAQYFYGNWRERVYDESIAECLTNWLTENEVVNNYRERLRALPQTCLDQLLHLCRGGKLLSHRPEIHLETSEEIRRLFLNGFLCTNLLPGYYQFRNLLSWYVVEERAALNPAPISLLRRSANARVNDLLQDIELSLRAMLRTVFRQMSPDHVQKLLKNHKSNKKLYQTELQTALFVWSDQVSVKESFNIKESLGKLLKDERDKFDSVTNLWTDVCRVFRESFDSDKQDAEPTPDQIISCLTLKQLSDLFQSLADKVFLDKARSKRMVDSPKIRWPDYLAKVRRLRNDAAHFRNISFQDIEDLLEILDSIRRDQLDFLIIPEPGKGPLL